MNYFLARILQLRDKVVLINGRSRKVASRINESRQCSRGETLEPLQCGCRRIRNERKEKGIVRLLLCRFVQDWKRVMEMAGRNGVGGSVGRLGLCLEWYGEVVSQCINYYYNCFVKRLGMPAPLLRISRHIRARCIDWWYCALRLVIED
jgi:hypothetical protein